jgi:hypothetical protein
LIQWTYKKKKKKKK